MPDIIRTKPRYHIHDINNFLKTDAEIITDFKVRINSAANEIDRLYSDTDFSHDRIVKKTIDTGNMFYIQQTSVYMEENY